MNFIDFVGIDADGHLATFGQVMLSSCGRWGVEVGHNEMGLQTTFTFNTNTNTSITFGFEVFVSVQGAWVQWKTVKCAHSHMLVH